MKVAPLKLHNRYFVLRHGQSEANAKEVIASNPDLDRSRYGLTDLGREQVMRSVTAEKSLTSSTRIVASDFLRAKESADIAAKGLKATRPVEYDLRLRERWFGSLDTKHHSHYQSVWDHDKGDDTHQEQGVESIVAVANRIADLISDLEATHQGETILLVGHGDTLQILQAWLNGTDLRDHTGFALSPGEVRTIQLSAA